MDRPLDLWGNVGENSGVASDILPLMQQQAELLETKTEGKIKACFDKVIYQYNGITAQLTALAAAARIGKEKEPDELKDLEDAGELFEHEKYKFEIYSSKYRYRLFTLNYRSVFPVVVEVEYGIIKDEAVTKEINSLNEMEELLGDIFTSRKVRFIMQKMKELSSN